MKYGIYYNDGILWGGFKSEQQAYDFISYYDLTENPYTVKSYNF